MTGALLLAVNNGVRAAKKTVRPCAGMGRSAALRAPYRACAPVDLGEHALEGHARSARNARRRGENVEIRSV